MSDKILIVDDEPSNRKILEQELVHIGFAVDTACGGREALAKVASAPPDLLILDYMMPDMSGLEVLRELRKKGSDTPVIMITAYGSVERAVEAMKAGALRFVSRTRHNLKQHSRRSSAIEVMPGNSPRSFS